VRERFTPLPCSGQPKERSTIEEEGCIERQILATDAQINASARSIFALLATNAARRAFIAAQTAWLNYRRTDCASVSDIYEGGTLAGVVDAACTAERSGEREKDLRRFLSDLRRNR
jgi:uncharacterized protein YecT (DUF1311 family)